jgi:hypothetical protein
VSFLSIICGKNPRIFLFSSNKLVTINCQRIISSHSNMCSYHLIYGYLTIIGFFFKVVSFLCIICGENSRNLWIYKFDLIFKFLTVNCINTFPTQWMNLCSYQLIYGYLRIISFFLKNYKFFDNNLWRKFPQVLHLVFM